MSGPVLVVLREDRDRPALSTAQPGLSPPPTDGGVAGVGLGSGVASGAGSASASGAAPPPSPWSCFDGSSVVSSSSYSLYSYSLEEPEYPEVLSLSSSDS